MPRFLPALALLALLAGPAPAQRPPDTVFLEELTWTELRDLQRAGTRTVIVATAGTEQKGPHMVMGEHHFVVEAAAEAIARALGNAVVAPVITYVPEGSWEPPLRGHMAKAGTITLPEDRFIELLVHAGQSLRAGGFTTVIYIGDSGGNQRGMQATADTLNAAWRGTGARALFIGDYYTKSAADIRTVLVGKGYTLEQVGSHAGMTDTSELWHLHPQFIRTDRLAPGGGSKDSGVSGDPTKADPALGAAMMDIKVQVALAQIRALLAAGGQR